MRSADTGTADIVPVRSTWRRPAPSVTDRAAEVVAQVLGITRWAPPPPGVAWRLALRRLLLTAVGLALWLTWTPP